MLGLVCERKFKCQMRRRRQEWDLDALGLFKREMEMMVGANMVVWGKW